jgi:hypothetical protein
MRNIKRADHRSEFRIPKSAFRIPMSRLEVANLIRVFDFYLAVMALFSFLRRYSVYRDAVLILVAVRGRWPRLAARMRQHQDVLVNWPTLRPGVLVLMLMTTQLVASRLIWPEADLRLADLYDPWWQLVPFLLGLLPMAAIDGYFLVRVGTFDRIETEKYMDLAERWAGTWKAKAVKVATLGRVNPDRQVHDEVRKSLAELGQTVNWSMWWVSAQAAARLTFGLTIWLLWAAR